MKSTKLLLLDKITIGFAILNMISYLIGIVFYGMLYDGSILYSVVSANGLYIVLGTPFINFAGVVINLISLIKKVKNKSSININILLFIVLVLMLSIWRHFLWQALIGV